MSNKQDFFKTEDWWSVWLGLFIFLLSLGSLAGLDLLGWAITPKVWTEFTNLSHQHQRPTRRSIQ